MSRSLLRITGDDRISFLQGILSNDIAKLNADKIQFAALLSPQGKILHDMFVVSLDDAILLDTQTAYKDTLLKRLMMYKLRAKVTVEEVTSHPSLVISLPDPRHPDLPPYSPLAIHDSTLSLGIPELGRDFEPDSITAMDAGYDLLHAISFTKGCYVGQEVTARMHYKSIARKGFFILSQDTMPTRLALLKFEDAIDNNGRLKPAITVDNMEYRITLPVWMQPKFQQFLKARAGE